MTSAFIRFGHTNARDPATIRAALDPPDGETPVLPLEVAGGLDNLRKLDAIAQRIFTQRADKRYPAPAQVAFALGLDKKDDQARLRAIVARVYWRANQYAEKLWQMKEDLKQAEEIALRLRDALEVLAAPERAPRARRKNVLDEEDDDSLKTRLFDRGRESFGPADGSAAAAAVALANKRRAESEPTKKGRAEETDDAIRALWERYVEMRAFAAGGRKKGRPLKNEPTFFLALRLAEVFTIWTGEPPNFSHDEKFLNEEKKTPDRGSAWSPFAAAAFALCGLETDDLNDVMKKIGSRGPGAKAYYALDRYEDAVIELTKKIAPTIEHLGNTRLFDELYDHVAYYLEASLDPKLVAEFDENQRAFVESLRRALAEFGTSAEEIDELRKKSERASPREAMLRSEFAEEDKDGHKKAGGLFKRYYNRSDFQGGHLPSTDYLVDMGLAPEPAGYE